jgi:hypothetical protein
MQSLKASARDKSRLLEMSNEVVLWSIGSEYLRQFFSIQEFDSLDGADNRAKIDA